jgi:hypothetical protein
MGNRVLIGTRGSDKGLFISQPGVDVTDTSVTTPLAFDSRSAAGLFVAGGSSPLRGEGDIAAPPQTGNGLTITPTTATISHGLGYRPAFAVRWCYPADLDGSSIATKMYTPSNWLGAKVTISNFSVTIWHANGGIKALSSASSPYNITISNYEGGTYNNVSASNLGTSIIHYAYVIFAQKDYTGGESL